MCGVFQAHASPPSRAVLPLKGIAPHILPLGLVELRVEHLLVVHLVLVVQLLLLHLLPLRELVPLAGLVEGQQVGLLQEEREVLEHLPESEQENPALL